ncbi:MAG: uroporphyrinogen-III C-methyltransferase [Clostridia bacterium]|nr:uroporphyrinogen-III C-methyltransferase [Clostridia bacterium]
MSGKVWLVGAGPGDRGLFTLRGLEVLTAADVVVYDALVGDGVLGMIPPEAELIYVGKRSSHHAMVQEDINRTLLEQAKLGKNVVRLKGGDPFLFGRGGEELELLTEAGIPFEIVPGVTSAFAVPAYNGIPVTHRDYCSSVHVVTGHRRAGEALDIDFEALARTGGTLVFLMGVAALSDIVSGLMKAGMPSDTPAAVLEKGCTAGQRRVLGTLATLETEAERANVRTPAIIVVGRVCGLAERFHWQEDRPLFGVRAIVMRPRHLVSGLSDLLRREGAEVVELPAIRIAKVTGAAWDKVIEAIHSLQSGGYDWLVFTSPSGAKLFMDALMEDGDLRALAGVKLAAIGEGTRKALRQYGLRADFLPTVYDGETLGRELREVAAPGSRILIPRAAIGNKALIDALGDGFDITDLPTYDTLYERSPVFDVKAMVEADGVNLCVFTSASTVRGFAEGAGDVDFNKVNAVCIGRQTAAEAQKRGMRTWTAERATLEELVRCAERAAGELR